MVVSQIHLIFSLNLFSSGFAGQYVLCKECSSGNTVMVRDGRLRSTFIQCDTCGSRKPATKIQTGYRAVTTMNRRAVQPL